MEGMSQFIVLLPGEDNYAIATKTIELDDEDKEFILPNETK